MMSAYFAMCLILFNFDTYCLLGFSKIDWRGPKAQIF